MANQIFFPSLITQLARPTAVLLTADLDHAMTVATVRAASFHINRPSRRERGLHTATKYRYRSFHRASPLFRPTISRTSKPIPLDQRACFWHRTSRSPFSAGSSQKNAEDAAKIAEQIQRDWEQRVAEVNSAHERIRRRHMEFMKRRLESDPFDVLFGWRERLREGQPAQVWVRGSEVLKAKGAERDAEGVGAVEVEKDHIVRVAETEKSPAFTVDAKQSRRSSPRSAAPESAPETVDFGVEYDPIANRMVQKTMYSTNQGHSRSHQQSSTGTIKPDVASEQEPSLQAQYEQFKAQRLPQSSSNQEDIDSRTAKTFVPDQEHTTSLSDAIQRAKLESSFEKLHSPQNFGEDNITRPVTFVNDKRIKTEADIKILSERIKNVGQRVKALQAKNPAQNPGSTSPPMESPGPNTKLASEELLRKQFREFHAATAKEAQHVGEGTSALKEEQSTSRPNKRFDPEDQQAAEELLRKQFREFHAMTAKEAQHASKTDDIPHKPVSFRRLPVEEQQSNVEQGAQRVDSTEPVQHVYEILAYDPVTSEVNNTTISAPIDTKEEILGVSEALSRLSEPAKFLPYLRLLKDQGFLPVAATNNMLVLRGAARKGQIVIDANSASTVEADTAGSGGSGNVNDDHDLSRDTPRHHKHRGWRRRRRLFKRVIFVGAATGAVIYFVGNRRETRPRPRTQRTDSYPETEEELYRMMRETNKPRKDSYPGMRKVVYPKDRES